MPIIILFTFILSLSVRSADIPKLSMVMPLKHSNETTLVFQEKKEWYCTTEILPYFFPGEKPFEEAALKELLQQPEATINCHRKALFSGPLIGKNKAISRCLDHRPTQLFVSQLNKFCGR